MSGTCQQLAELASSGVAPALRAVDCMAAETISSGFARVGALAPALTILLTLYIAFFAFSLITGRSALGIPALTPRMLTLGLVLTFATSWLAYQTFILNLAIGGPDWIASILMGAKGSATQIFGDRIDIVFQAIGDASQNASNAAGGDGGQAPAAAAAAAQGGMFTPESVMWLGALVLLLGTVGVLLTARIALAVLLALGPVFVVMALFGGTRGLTAGWLRGVVLTAVTPLFVVLGGGITLELLVPIVAKLVQDSQMGEIDGRMAMALFLVAAVHMALMAMVLKVAGTLVSGWQVFGLAGSRRTGSRDAAASFVSAPTAGAPLAPVLPVQSRPAAVSAATSAAAMADPSQQGGQGAGGSDRRRTVVTQVAGGGVEPLAQGNASRARGIGSRFRSASNDSGRLPAKEKIR
ncbi:MAG TPA: type IV secretion system protein [Novosphingobium sp.]|nr:type IV secretion system protein [Novosphingobium sp.]